MTISEELRERIAAELRNLDECDMTDGEYIDALADAVGSGSSGTLHEMLADLVEHQLPESVEWPRFEDGELVKVGDDVEYKGETMRVYLATFDADGWALWCSREGIDGRLSGKYGERVKRHAPKVLDADGVQIKVDDTVYFVDGDARPLTVERIDANGGEPAVDLVYAGQILHWHSANPEKLTHERPDSWKRIEDDAYHLVMSEYLETPEEDVRDLVRRAKALAKADSEARGVE